MGQMANAVRADLEAAIESRSSVLAEKALEERLEAEAPGHHRPRQGP